jgi:hypothetical protein
MPVRLLFSSSLRVGTILAFFFFNAKQAKSVSELLTKPPRLGGR